MIDRARIDELIREIEGYARGYGLDFFPVIFELLDYEEINMVAAYGGFPSRYPHWRFGMQYEYMGKSYGYGLHRIYEMVINNNPCYAYLLNSNQLVDQKLVIAHVFAHCDFFKNNMYFSRTNRKAVDEMANHGVRIQRYMDRYGRETVENFIDVCSSLENLIDATALFGDADRPLRILDEDEPAVEDVGRLRSRAYMDPYVNPPEYLEARRRRREEERRRQEKFPPEEVRDVLRFLIEYAPLRTWQRDVLSIVREEAYYFAPQAQTKIMNEGWASYWHERIMTEKALDPSELVDFADHHSGTLAMHPGQLNPYKLGYELFHDIEERWDRGRHGPDYEACTDWQARRHWDTGAGEGREKIFQVRAIYNDMTFIDEFLTEEFCREHRLFTYAWNERTGNWEIDSRSFRKIRETLLFSLTNMGHPRITVVDANWDNRGELYLKHHFDGVPLRLDYARATLENLHRIWTRPVHVQTVIDDAPTILSWDGREHRETPIGASNAA